MYLLEKQRPADKYFSTVLLSVKNRYFIICRLHPLELTVYSRDAGLSIVLTTYGNKSS